MELTQSNTNQEVVYTHKLTKIGSNYRIEAIAGGEPIIVFRDFQKVEPSLRRKKIWGTTQGLEQLPKVNINNKLQTLALPQPLVISSVCTCTKFRETPMVNGKHICSICNKPIVQTDR